MGVREKTLDMLRDGLSPKEISRKMGVNINTTLPYLDQLVGRGDLRRSDILFSIPKDIRHPTIEIVENERLSDSRVVVTKLKEQGIDVEREDVEVVLKYGDARHALGDMYEDIRNIETHLHQLIRKGLEEEYGEGELNWWRQGIPESIRKSCQCRREEDTEAVVDPYCYTDLLDLWQILDKQWTVLSKLLPDRVRANKQALRGKLARVNTIRRNVMHPVRGIVPSEDDFEFVHELKELIVRAH